MLATADMREVDLTLSDFDWKAMLKRLPAGAELVGTRVCKFTCRWLSDVCDLPIQSKWIVASFRFSTSQILLDLRRIYTPIKMLLRR